jgi:demethylmenaquinone methyltransferase / 2-methoxy-6-polyprenyl-1,4-benzoquinol methylase
MTQPLWSDKNLSNPHEVQDKASRVQKMFAAISRSYDLNNRVHSLGRDQSWRRAAVKAAMMKRGDRVLDVACGTGDLSFAFARGGAGEVVGVDFTFEMLDIARQKNGAGQEKRGGGLGPVRFVTGDAMRLPLPDGGFDVVSIAFGIRNVATPQVAIDEFARVLKPGGRLIVLEFGRPKSRLFRGAYDFYFKRIMPRTASMIAGDKTGAYDYLPQSVSTFIDKEGMLGMMGKAGFGELKASALTFGVAWIYRGVKRESNKG